MDDLSDIFGIRDMVPVEDDEVPNPQELRRIARRNWFVRMAEDFHTVPAPDQRFGVGTLMGVLYPDLFASRNTAQTYLRRTEHDLLKPLGLMDPARVHVIDALIWTGGRWARRDPVTVWVCKKAFPKRADAEKHLFDLLPDLSRTREENKRLNDKKHRAKRTARERAARERAKQKPPKKRVLVPGKDRS